MYEHGSEIYVHHRFVKVRLRLANADENKPFAASPSVDDCKLNYPPLSKEIAMVIFLRYYSYIPKFLLLNLFWGEKGVYMQIVGCI